MRAKPGPQVVAALVGLAAIGGFLGLAHWRQNAIRLISVRSSVDRYPNFGYPGVLVKLGGRLFDHSEGYGAPVEYRLRDGLQTLPLNGYGGGNGELLIPLGYAKPIEHPRLEVYQDRRLLRTLDLPPLPLPVRTLLEPKPHPFFRLVALGDDPFSSPLDPQLKSGETRPTLEAIPRYPIPKNEGWDIDVLRTPFCRLPGGHSLFTSWGTDAIRLALPYAATAGEAEVVVRRTRKVERFEDVRIPDLQLVRTSDGQTLLTIASDRVVTTSDGTRFRLFRQNARRPKAVPRPDERSVTLPAIVETQSMDIRLVSPSLQELGVRRFAVPNARDQFASRRDQTHSDVERPVRTTPFTAVLRIAKTESVTFQTVRACVPMERPLGASKPQPR